MFRPQAFLQGIGKGARIGTGKFEVAALVAARSAGVAQTLVIIYAHGKDVKLATPVEVPTPRMGEPHRLGLLADTVGKRDADVVGAGCKRDLKPLLALNPPESTGGVSSFTCLPLTCTRSTRMGSGVGSMAIATVTCPPCCVDPAEGESSLNRGTGLASRSASLNAVPGASRMAASAERKIIARSTTSGRLRWARSWSAVMYSAACSGPLFICHPTILSAPGEPV